MPLISGIITSHRTASKRSPAASRASAVARAASRRRRRDRARARAAIERPTARLVVDDQDRACAASGRPRTLRGGRGDTCAARRQRDAEGRAAAELLSTLIVAAERARRCGGRSTGRGRCRAAGLVVKNGSKIRAQHARGGMPDAGVARPRRPRGRVVGARAHADLVASASPVGDRLRRVDEQVQEHLAEPRLVARSPAATRPILAGPGARGGGSRCPPC